MTKSTLRTKSFRFAVRIVNLYKHLCEEKNEFGKTDYLSDIEFGSIHNDAVELIKILTSSIKTAKLSLTVNH